MREPTRNRLAAAARLPRPLPAAGSRPGGTRLPAPLLVALTVLCLGGRTAHVEAGPLREIVIDRDNIEIRESCRVTAIAGPVRDADDNGVVHIVGDDLVVDFGDMLLSGNDDPDARDRYAGVGVVVTGRGVTVRHLRLGGYRLGLRAVNADRLTIEDVSVESNLSQRLRSTVQAEDAGDWLWPHRNDDGEWCRTYGAGISVERSRDVTVRRVTVRRSQNGIVLDRVEGSRIYNNDCSFLSGWGLAMWRSSGNIVSRNAFDFCIRGYSHGVYNRGQDSAGILLFEQCSRNAFVENSCTHGGDGIFGFAGREALGEASPGDVESDWHRERGCNENIFVNNDLSYAAAHGLEITFSTGNRIHGNRFAENAICGIWGGYGRATVIGGNHFDRNGEMAYGLERGGVNMEHATGTIIFGNVFSRNRCGVHFWWDADEPITALPWGVANDVACHNNVIARNRFNGDTVAIHLRDVGMTYIADNTFTDVGTEIEADAQSRLAIEPSTDVGPDDVLVPAVTALGDTRPVGARRTLRGRAAIVMTEWGPYDHRAPLVRRLASTGAVDHYRLLGDVPVRTTSVVGRGPLRNRFDPETQTVQVYTAGYSQVCPYELRLSLEDQSRVTARGLVASLDWTIRFFPFEVDPRGNDAAWARASQDERHVEVRSRSLDLHFGNGTPADALRRLATDESLHPIPPEVAIDGPVLVRAAEIGSDRFGTIATTSAEFRPGRYRVVIVSDDGVRLRMDDDLVIDNWTWHPPTEDTFEFTVAEDRTVRLRLESFELDGFARLGFRIEAMDH